MGFLRLLLGEYLRRRLMGGRHRHSGGWFGGYPGGYRGAPRGYGHWMGPRHRGGPFGFYGPRPRARVRGCGCCLPIPLGALGVAALGLRLLLRVRSR